MTRADLAYPPRQTVVPLLIEPQCPFRQRRGQVTAARTLKGCLRALRIALAADHRK